MHLWADPPQPSPIRTFERKTHMLSLRQRGTQKIWYIRGSVAVGDETIIVKERSTGCAGRQAAEAYRAKLIAECQDQILFGKASAHKKVTFNDIVACYIQRVEDVHRNDILRLRQIGEHLSGVVIKDIKSSWIEFVRNSCKDNVPGTVARKRTTLLAAMRYYGNQYDIQMPTLPPVKVKNDRIRFLTETQQELLLESYATHVQPIILTYCFQGCRTQEALQLKWPSVSFDRDNIFFGDTKSKVPRSVPMHPRARAALEKLWHERGCPDSGHVFLNRRNQPYADTRTYQYPGGNPLKSAHSAACKRAGIDDFRVHDWRHHWASWCVMKGVDLESIRRMGGWANLDMLQRYAAVSTEHLRNAIRKL
jgi:integrase